MVYIYRAVQTQRPLLKEHYIIARAEYIEKEMISNQPN